MYFKNNKTPSLPLFVNIIYRKKEMKEIWVEKIVAVIVQEIMDGKIYFQ
jgi:hypothetical protein